MVGLLFDCDFYAQEQKCYYLLLLFDCTIIFFFKTFTLSDSMFVVKKERCL